MYAGGKTCRGAAAAMCLLAAPAATAGALDDASREILGAEIAKVLTAEPEIVARALNAPPAPADIYRDAVARDLDTIAGLSARLFAPTQQGFGPAGQRATIALFTRGGCAPCKQAEAELRKLTSKTGVRVALFDMDEHAELAAKLGLDSAPSYVMRDRMLRGHMPAIVLKRYIREARAQD